VEDTWEKSREKLFCYLDRKRERGVTTRIVVNMIDFRLNRASIDQLKAYWEGVPGVDEFCPKTFGTWIGDAQEINELKDGTLNVLIEQDRRQSYVSCNRRWEILTVTWDGDVVPCCYDYDKKEPPGNVLPFAAGNLERGTDAAAVPAVCQRSGRDAPVQRFRGTEGNTLKPGSATNRAFSEY